MRAGAGLAAHCRVQTRRADSAWRPLAGADAGDAAPPTGWPAVGGGGDAGGGAGRLRRLAWVTGRQQVSAGARSAAAATAPAGVLSAGAGRVLDWRRAGSVGGAVETLGAVCTRFTRRHVGRVVGAGVPPDGRDAGLRLIPPVFDTRNRTRTCTASAGPLTRSGGRRVLDARLGLQQAAAGLVT